jgi:hypothetical protein
VGTFNDAMGDLINLLKGLLDDTYRTPMWPPLPQPDAFNPNWNTSDQTFSNSVLRVGLDLVFDNPNASMALVDLTNPTAPSYAGVNDQAEIEIASVGKICAMYAAYQLREDCRFLAKSLSTSDPAAASQTVLNSSLAKWSDAGNPPYIQAIAQSPPNLDNIFDFTHGDDDSWNVDFKLTPSITTTADPNPTDPTVIASIKSALDSLDEAAKHARSQASRNALAQVSFLEWLRLMIGFSNNTAAGFCIRNLGFPYIDALMQQTGLVNPTAATGLRLAYDYDYMAPEDAWPGQALKKIHHAGNAQMLAKFFTLLEQGSLVSAAACIEMNGLLDRTLWRGVRSFLGEDGENSIPLGGANKVCTKIGINTDQTTIHDAGWIVHDALNYVAVVLNVTNMVSTGNSILDARVKLEGCLQNRQ